MTCNHAIMLVLVSAYSHGQIQKILSGECPDSISFCHQHISHTEGHKTSLEKQLDPLGLEGGPYHIPKETYCHLWFSWEGGLYPVPTSGSAHVFLILLQRLDGSKNKF